MSPARSRRVVRLDARPHRRQGRHLDRSPRYLLIAAALALGACGGGERTFELTSPTGLPEWTPGGQVDFTWTLSGGDGFLEIEVTSIDGSYHTFLANESIPEGPGELPFVGVDMDAHEVPPDVYDVHVTVLDSLDSGNVVDEVMGTMAVDGIAFTDPAPGTTATGAPAYTIEVTTVSLNPFDLTVKLDDHVIDTRHINGELVPFHRQVFFDGTDTDGVAVPSGMYTVGGYSDNGPGAPYHVDGGRLSF